MILNDRLKKFRARTNIQDFVQYVRKKEDQRHLQYKKIIVYVKVVLLS